MGYGELQIDEYVRKVRELTQQVQQFSAEQFVRTLLLFVNERDDELKRQLFWKIRFGYVPEKFGHVHGLENLQLVLETWLNILLNEDDLNGLTKLARTLIPHVNKVILLPSIELESTQRGPAFRRTDRYIPEDEVSAFAVGAMHLLHMVQSGESLCRCKLQSCGNWFLAFRNKGKSMGLLQHVYCSTEHSKAATLERKAAAGRLRRAKAKTKPTRATRRAK